MDGEVTVLILVLLEQRKKQIRSVGRNKVGLTFQDTALVAVLLNTSTGR